MTRALAARTESDLSRLLADLPSLREAASAPQSRAWAPRLPFLVPLLFVTVLIVGSGAHWPAWRMGAVAAVVAHPDHRAALRLVAPRPATPPMAVIP